MSDSNSVSDKRRNTLQRVVTTSPFSGEFGIKFVICIIQTTNVLVGSDPTLMSSNKCKLKECDL